MALFGRKKPTVVDRATEPRDIPTLFPAFYENLLVAHGKPVTPENTVALVERTALMIMAGGVQPWMEQMGEHERWRLFQQRFALGNVPGDRILQAPDDMIDSVWAWDDGIHPMVRQMVGEKLPQFLGEYLDNSGDRLPTMAEY